MRNFSIKDLRMFLYLHFKIGLFIAVMLISLVLSCKASATSGLEPFNPVVDLAREAVIYFRPNIAKHFLSLKRFEYKFEVLQGITNECYNVLFNESWLKDTIDNEQKKINFSSMITVTIPEGQQRLTSSNILASEIIADNIGDAGLGGKYKTRRSDDRSLFIYSFTNQFAKPDIAFFKNEALQIVSNELLIAETNLLFHSFRYSVTVPVLATNDFMTFFGISCLLRDTIREEKSDKLTTFKSNGLIMIFIFNRKKCLINDSVVEIKFNPADNKFQQSTQTLNSREKRWSVPPVEAFITGGV